MRDTPHRPSHAAPAYTLVVSLALAISASARADRIPSSEPASEPPPPSQRCRVFEVAQVPAAYADFERRITAWMATCVTSRTGDAHRELALVRDNHSLRAVWNGLTKGQPAHIVPRYTWGEFRVIRVTFSSPEADAWASHIQAWPTGRPPARAADQTSPLPTPQPDAGAGAIRPPEPSGKPEPGAPQIRRPAREPPPFAPRIGNDVDDLLLDARRLVEDMRRNGKTTEADRLDRYIATAAKAFGSVAVLVGGYYVGVKLRAGRLLFAWGWNATGEHFARVAGRLKRLLPEAERAIADVITSARPHVPPAGSGVDWQVLNQVVNGTVPAQFAPQRSRPHRPRWRLDRRQGVGGPNLARTDGQRGDRAYRSAWSLDRSGRSTLRRRDGFDANGHVQLRDPWYEPGRARGINSGSSYSVSLRTFVQNWLAVAIYRKSNPCCNSSMSEEIREHVYLATLDRDGQAMQYELTWTPPDSPEGWPLVDAPVHMDYDLIDYEAEEYKKRPHGGALWVPAISKVVQIVYRLAAGETIEYPVLLDER